ncbi:creatininase family protein [Elioraea sp. Yellowstone]|uniref:creatininase family protein n=1 Tax=Elioraea sp. Yellowstone TaxID=2592070 RepID=UPI001152CF26|nr:creatininase family protein [Elioraea sp. Yellowstone]TQF80799.1 creatininase family protein [Elioraea sp. Yellowstone]
MLVREANWMQVEAWLRRDDRCVLPIGSIEQHAHLSLAVDAILAERVAAEAAEPLGVPVFPVMPYGLAPYFMAYPGTVSLRVSTLLAVVGDILDSLHAHGFRRILVVNGHGGNAPVDAFCREWVARQPAGTRVRFHTWFNAPRVWAKVQATDPVGSHASWLENFPWTRLAAAATPEGAKPPVDAEAMRQRPAGEIRAMLGDGSLGGRYRRPDEEMLAIWQVGVEETRAAIETGWGDA